jgi:hypothetical protein
MVGQVRERERDDEDVYHDPRTHPGRPDREVVDPDRTRLHVDYDHPDRGFKDRIEEADNAPDSP